MQHKRRSTIPCLRFIPLLGALVLVAVASPVLVVAVASPASAATVDTIVDSGPANPTSSTTASFTFHSTGSGPTYSCTIDAGTAAKCTSPKAYTALAAGSHTFAVASTSKGVKDSSPATYTWTVDTPPTVPTQLTATATPTSVALGWTASTDNTGVAGYDVFRGGALLASVGAVTTYVDTSVTLGTIYTYAVRAQDTAGNLSAFGNTVSVKALAPYSSHLTRAPYLTDLVGQHVAINFATDETATTGSVTYGAVDGSGNCSPATTVAASRITIQVNTTSEYQWTAQVNLAASGTYCYRAYLGATDLLAGNLSPQFTTQVPVGSTAPFSFDVLGDWGEVDANGSPNDEANLFAQIATSGALFAVTVGDNGYVSGNEADYGDLQHLSTSAIFGAPYWTIPGASVPLFAATGNHGLADTHHTDITTWTQASTVLTSNGRDTNDVYCCVGGSSSANYGSVWYAFNAGNARFYVLDSAWGDTNGGTAGVYADDALAHFAPGTPEYQWLLNDLQTHPAQLKFAFSHYPLYSDNKSQPSDTALQGAANLEGMLGQNGVQIAFNGHAHIYERNTPSASGMPITYVTGGGGGLLEPVGPCVTANDAYAIGWSPTKHVGSACAGGKAPASAANTFHFLKVTVSGQSVTVAPTDSLGNTFDVQTYTFTGPPDTYVDSTPPSGTATASATFTFHASDSSATFSCTLDAGPQTPCVSPASYAGLSDGTHTFTVAATVNNSTDPSPAAYTWVVDSTPPTTPGGFTATAQSPIEVDLGWSASTDNTGVTGYDVFRDGALYQSLGPVTSYADTSVLASSTHQYAVRARDAAGNVSADTSTISVTTPPATGSLFSDGFESGTLHAWTATSGLTVESSTVHGGVDAAEGSTQNGNTYAKVTLPGAYSNGFARVWFDVVSQSSQVNLLRLRDTASTSIGYVFVSSVGQLGFYADATAKSTISSTVVTPGWHSLELNIQVGATAGALGVVQIWLDNTLVTALSSSAINVGSTPIGGLQIGDVQTARIYDVAYDDVGFGTSRIGSGSDTTPPSVPANVTASATSPFSIQVGWSASTDDVGVTGYDLYRDGSLFRSLGTVTSFTDNTVLGATTHTYAVLARDQASNVSALSAPASATTPAAATPLFSDGFESGTFGAWTSNGGLALESTDAHSGTVAAEGVATNGAVYAKKTLPVGPYSDAYARVWVEMKTLPNGTIGLLRLRDTSAGSVADVFLTSAGKLGFSGGAFSSSSTVSLGTGWHMIEVHVLVSGTSSSYQVWLDGQPVTGLSGAFDLTGSGAVTILQVGDSSAVTGRTYDAVYDDAAFSTSRIGF